MMGGIMYQQSTRNRSKPAKEVKAQENEEEQEKLLEMQTVIESSAKEKPVTKSREGNKRLQDSHRSSS
ncbi:GDP-mannose transporter GONST3-like [Olea europaea subsp. europaea]|uniref:GDP-mannose transporter GONST3-like n=1 Tax=Olea europaea subsp. europaea TaxID=158383 RepID=A0A8S0TS71_OLEEU|nr:GDP-mannose transporter GONST3-like [Olea europaea subsp. europaea]